MLKVNTTGGKGDHYCYNFSLLSCAMIRGYFFLEHMYFTFIQMNWLRPAKYE